MDATNFNNDKPEVVESFECYVSRVSAKYSNCHKPAKNYLVKKSGGIKERWNKKPRMRSCLNIITPK
ncbi:unnamed protein product [Rhizophagus irregularis]|uniref:Uncharacterized protein n=1 Tax=Rhizophagus irregularis TaxID=588596 RepID=A0A915ZKU6_9GLOM|nr:unnamed protein product [Rhizophagus irregularis]CAB5210798.1 unnamed protein product [Rhizophagus irregularis]CAB5380384.1 unnamed protein product [Rhizophagus irregularis]